MKHTTVITTIGAAILTIAGCVNDRDTDDGFRSGMGEDGGHSCPGAAPIMQVGDFDGDGLVDNQDVAMLSDFKDAGDYAAYFDMNVDGVLDGQDVAIVAQNIGQPGTARDAQMAQLWQTLVPFRDVQNALDAGYIPFTPDLEGHGIHFVNLALTNDWEEHGFDPGAPEGLNYTAEGELVAAFYYATAEHDLADLGMPLAKNMFFEEVPMPAESFDGIAPHEWHNHVGACFGGATSPVPGFDQCMSQADCDAVGGSNWSAKFHMLHVWMFELNECGPFGGVDEDISVGAPEEPNHMACELEDVVHCVVVGWHEDGTPMCAESDGGHHDH